MTAFLMTNATQDDASTPSAQHTTALWFEDMEPGLSLISPSHRIDRSELLEFAKIWDPLPIHIDEQAGVQAFGSLTAPGLFILAVKQRLIHQLPKMNVIASLGYDDVRFNAPMRPNDTVVLRLEWVASRISESKPDRGIVTARFILTNQHGEKIMSHTDTILVRRRKWKG